MSVLKPVKKQARTMNKNPSTLVRTESTDLQAFVEERDHRTITPPSGTTTAATTETKEYQPHPKGHKVRELSEIWKLMDKQSFLRLTDTLTLDDVWFQPISCEPAPKGPFAILTCKQMVAGPHMKVRECQCRISNDDLIKILYLNEKIQWDLQGFVHLSFEDWLNEKSANCVKAKGLDEGSNRAKLCNFIMCDEHDFTFYPACLRGIFGIFFRKICYHSYKTDNKDEEKMENPSMIKCCASSGKFEYVLEARMFPLPTNWNGDISALPESQLLC